MISTKNSTNHNNLKNENSFIFLEKMPEYGS